MKQKKVAKTIMITPSTKARVDCVAAFQQGDRSSPHFSKAAETLVQLGFEQWSKNNHSETPHKDNTVSTDINTD